MVAATKTAEPILIAKPTMTTKAALFTSTSAKAAHSSAHHLVRKRGNLLTVYVHCAAGEGYTAIIVESRIAVYGNSTSGDDDIAVGIDAIGIACAHRDCDCATRNFYSWCVLGGLVRSVDSIIRSLNRNITAADKDIGRFDPFKGRNIPFA